jgi:hypothetical protein
MNDKQQPSEASPPALPKRSPWFGLSTLLSVLSLMSVALASLGYGMSHAVESKVGIPHAALFASVFELVDLSSLPITTFLEQGDLLFDLSTWLVKVPLALWIPLAGSLVLWLIVLSLIVPAWRLPLQRLKALRPKGWFVRPRRGDSWRQILKSFVWPLMASLGMVFVAWAWLFVVWGLAVVMSLFPMIGYALGHAHLQRWVIEADACTPLRTAAQRVIPPQKKSAEQTSATGKTRREVNCVSLIKDRETLITGRVVIASPSAIVVFDPATGVVRRESLGGVSVLAAEF